METFVAIGIDKKTDKVIAIESDARAQSIYVIGKSGTGKSNLLETIASQDMQNGDGLCFLDPHGDSAKRLLASVPSHREKDVIFWDPRDIHHPFGLNPFYCANPTNELEVSLKTQSFIDSLASLKDFAEIFKTAPLMKDMLQQLATTFIINQGHTLAETIQFLIDPEYRQQFYPALSGTYARFRRFWESEFDILSAHYQRGDYASSINKLRRFQSDPILYGIFGQPKNSIDFRRAMDERQIIIVDLSADTQGFIGAFIVWEILQAARSRGDIPQSERRPFHLFSDEFQTYLTTAFPKLQAEARKYGVDTVVAHQVREQLDGELPELTRAVGNLIIFQVTYPNALALAGEFDTTPPPGEQVLKPVTERLTVEYPQYEMRWVDKDAKDAYKQITHETGRIYAYLSLLGRHTALGVYFPSDVERLVKRLTEKPDDPWFYHVYRWFNPAYFYEPVFKHWADQLYLAHSCKHEWDWQLKSFEKQAVYFPASMPWAIEMRLEEWTSYPDPKPAEYLYHHPEPPQHVAQLESEEIRQIAQKLLEDVKPFVAKLKAQTTGTYYFNPALHSYEPRHEWFEKRPIRSQLKRILEEAERTSPKRDWYVGAGDREGGYWDVEPRPEVLPWLVEKATALKRELDVKLPQAKELYKSYQSVEIVPGVYDDQVVRHEWVPGPQKSPDQVKDGISNEIVHLPKYQARCKLTQR